MKFTHDLDGILSCSNINNLLGDFGAVLTFAFSNLISAFVCNWCAVLHFGLFLRGYLVNVGHIGVIPLLGFVIVCVFFLFCFISV